jgi:hypothetical protein
MNTDTAAYSMAQAGLRQIEEAILRLMTINPQGLRNVEIANSLGLRSDFRGSHRNYLTYSILGKLIEEGKIVQNEKGKGFIISPSSHEQESGDDIDIATVGKAMYEEIRGELEAAQRGKVVIIDVKSGDYEIGDDDLEATLRMFERRPGALTWGERVGYPAMYSFKERVSFIKL